MIVNKKFDRLKQWTNEKLGASEVKTSVSDDFKSLEAEMQLRFDGMERLQKSMTMYVKSLSKRSEGDDREKNLPVGYLGSTMISHGEDYDPNSLFGSCLNGLGRANEGIARAQETYISKATSTWLESLERSLAQMKDYQAARKKLESRRLAYDTSLHKMERSKKEDFRMEEELRSQKAKYEESQEDVERRMQDIKEAEADTVVDLSAFLDAELAYYDRCRDILLQLREDWPAERVGSTDNRELRRGPRSRSNTTGSHAGRLAHQDEDRYDDSQGYSRHTSRGSSPRRELDMPAARPVRQTLARANTSEGPIRQIREYSPAPMPRLSRVPTEPSILHASRPQLRPVKRGTNDSNVFGDPSDDYRETSSPDRYYSDMPTSPTSSYGTAPIRTASWNSVDTGAAVKKAPPPPPPSRAKKPAPPPPPVKRSGLSGQYQ